MDSAQTRLPSDFSPLSLSSINLCQYLSLFSGHASGYKYIQVSKEITDDAKLRDAINQHLTKEMIELASKDGIALDIKEAKFVCVAIGADEDPYEEPSDPEDQSVRLVLNHEYRFSPIGIFYSDSKGNSHVAFRGTQTVKEIDYSTGRFRVWLNDDKKTIKSVLGVDIPGYMRAGTAEFLYRPVPIFGPVIDQLRYGLTCAKPNAPLYGAAHSLGGTLLSALVPLANMMGKFTYVKGTLLGSLNTFDDVGIKAVMNSAKIKVTNIWDKNDPIPTWGWGKTPFSVLGDRVTIDTGRFWIGAHPMSSYVPWIKNQLKG